MASTPLPYQITKQSKSFESNQNMNVEAPTGQNVNSSSLIPKQNEASHYQQQQQQQLSNHDEELLTPHPHDVLCGRGGLTNNHKGNAWYRRLVSCNRPLYRSSPKHTKLLVSKAIVEAVFSQSPPGRFLERHKKTGLWSPVPYKRAVDKTSQALREKERQETELHLPPHVNSGGEGRLANQQSMQQDTSLTGKSNGKMSLQELAMAAVERAGGMPDQMQTSAPPSPSKPAVSAPTPEIKPAEQTSSINSKIPTKFTSISATGAPLSVPAYSESLAKHHNHNQYHHPPPAPQPVAAQSFAFPQQRVQQGQQEAHAKFPPFRTHLNDQSSQCTSQRPTADVIMTPANGSTTDSAPSRNTQSISGKKHNDSTHPSSPNQEKKPRLLWNHHHHHHHSIRPPQAQQEQQYHRHPSHPEHTQQTEVSSAPPPPPPPLATSSSSRSSPVPPMLESLQTRASSLFRFLKDTNIYPESTTANNNTTQFTKTDTSEKIPIQPTASQQQPQEDENRSKDYTEAPVHGNKGIDVTTGKANKVNDSMSTSSTTSRSSGSSSDTPLLTQLVNVATSEYYLREKQKKKEKHHKQQHHHHRKQNISTDNDKNDTMIDFDPTQDMPALMNIASAPFRQVSSWGMPGVADAISVSSHSSTSSSKSPSPVEAKPSSNKNPASGANHHHEGCKEILAGVDGKKKVVGVTGGTSYKRTSTSSSGKPSLLDDYDESPVEARLRTLLPG